MWAEYHRLWKDEGWTQQRIADAKGCDRRTVVRRCGFHESLCKAATDAVCDGMFDEGHCEAVSDVMCDVAQFGKWLTTEQAQTELVQAAMDSHRGKSEGIKPTVKSACSGGMLDIDGLPPDFIGRVPDQTDEIDERIGDRTANHHRPGRSRSFLGTGARMVEPDGQVQAAAAPSAG